MTASDSSTLTAVADDCRSRPTQWVLVHHPSSRNSGEVIAHNIRRGTIQGYQPAGAFDAMVRTEDDTPAVWARYNPVARQAPAGTSPAYVSTVMDRRSWYMPKASADALAELVDGLHWETRRPKHEILAELVEIMIANRDKVAINN